MPIKRVGVGVTKTKVTGKKNAPEILVDGQYLSNLSHALDVAEAADRALEAAKITVKDVALLPYFQTCADNNTMVSTVMLHDNGSTKVRMTVQDKYPSIDLAQGTALFEGLSKDPGDYLTETVKVSFDNKVFVDTKTGEFNNNLYLAMYNALAKVAKDYGVENPLNSTTQVVAQPTFHGARFASFTPKQNAQIQHVFPATITLTRC